METNTEISRIVRNNAMSAYLMIFLSAAFLFTKQNPNIDHPFVKLHTKTALFLHSIIVLILVVFGRFSFLGNFSWNDYHLNSIIAAILLIGTLWFLLKGMYLAYHGKDFIIAEIIHFVRKEKLVSIKNGIATGEEDKATLIFSLIPFLSFVTYGKHAQNEMVKNLSKATLILSVFLSYLYIAWYGDLSLVLLLLWVIWIVFFSVQLVMQEEIMSIDLKNIPTPSELYTQIKGIKSYVKAHLGKGNFVPWKEIQQKEQENFYAEEKNIQQELTSKSEAKIPDWLTYIPVINLISLISHNSKKQIHIENGLGMTLMFLFSLLVILYDWNYLFFFFFPITYGYAFIETNLAYRIPVFYDIGNGTIHIFEKTKTLFAKAHEIKKTEKNISLKIEEK